MLAMTVLANTGHTEVPVGLLPLASEKAFRQAIAWGLAVRLCRKLTGGAEQALDATVLRRKGGRLVLEILPQAQALTSNSVAKNLRDLADWLGLEWSIDYPAESRKAS